MATYEETMAGTASFKLKEQEMYGSSRLGMVTDDQEMIGAVADLYDGSRLLSKKQFELINHLGNVNSVVTDKKIPVDANSDNTIDFYQPDIVSMQDYYAFGMLMPNRNFTTENYRFGFNGKENENNITGIGNSLDFGLRVFNPRTIRFQSIDPIYNMSPGFSTYNYAR